MKQGRTKSIEIDTKFVPDFKIRGCSPDTNSPLHYVTYPNLLVTLHDLLDPSQRQLLAFEWLHQFLDLLPVERGPVPVRGQVCLQLVDLVAELSELVLDLLIILDLTLLIVQIPHYWVARSVLNLLLLLTVWLVVIVLTLMHLLDTELPALVGVYLRWPTLWISGLHLHLLSLLLHLIGHISND